MVDYLPSDQYWPAGYWPSPFYYWPLYGAPAAPVVESRPRVLIGDRTGRLLAEVEPLVGPVSWRLNDVGRATLTFAKTDPKCIEDFLRFGNRVLIQFGNGLPDWGGVIDPPREWTAATVTATAYSAEYILGTRVTEKDRQFSGVNPMYVISQLLAAISADDPNLSYSQTQTFSGVLVSPELHYANIWTLTKSLLDETASDLWVRPILSSTDLIQFVVYGYELKRGVEKPNVVLLESHNLAGIGLSEQGPIINSWVTPGAGSTWGDERPVGAAQDDDSITEFGLREASEAHTETSDQETLDEIAANLGIEYAQPHNVFTLEAMDLPPARFADYDVGDSVRVMLHSYGFGGYDGLVRVLAREYDPARGVCRLVVQEAE
jgi:hypothetical protein